MEMQAQTTLILQALLANQNEQNRTVAPDVIRVIIESRI